MFSIISRLNKLSLCSYRFCPAPNLCISSSSPARKLTLEEKLGIRPKPKKPMSAFFRFAQEVVRPNLMRENPELLVTQVSKVAGERWKEADEALKKQLTEEYQREMVQYRAALEVYNEELSKVDQEKLRELKLAPVNKKEQKELKKLRTELGCPKKPISSFFLYLGKRRAEFPTSTPNKDLVATVSAEWKTLDPNEKAKYKEIQDKNIAIWEQEVESWEREMRETGNAHLLSPKKSRPSKRPKRQ